MVDSARLVLVGKTGVGKSSTANTIMGQRVFHAQSSATSVTRHCAEVSGIVCGVSVTLVDTPGFFDTSVSEKEIVDETVKCVTMLAPGPHVFLIVVTVGRFTAEEKDTVVKIQQIFGSDVGKYAIVLLTRADDLKADSISVDEFVKNAGSDLRSLITQCGGRYHAIDNRNQDTQQVRLLLEKVQSLKRTNGGCYTSAMFQLACQIREKEQQLEEAKKKNKDMTEIMKHKMEMQMKVAELEAQVRHAKRSVNVTVCTIS